MEIVRKILQTYKLKFPWTEKDLKEVIDNNHKISAEAYIETFKLISAIEEK